MVTRTSNPSSKVLAVLVLMVGAGMAACGGPSAYWNGGDVDIECREDPEDCDDGEIGGACQDDFDCADGVCCKDKNCDGGMCTYECTDDRDCPDVMSCEHGFCFFQCNEDADCGPGQSCEHGKTICEYEGGK